MRERPDPNLIPVTDHGVYDQAKPPSQVVSDHRVRQMYPRKGGINCDRGLRAVQEVREQADNPLKGMNSADVVPCDRLLIPAAMARAD